MDWGCKDVHLHHFHSLLRKETEHVQLLTPPPPPVNPQTHQHTQCHYNRKYSLSVTQKYSVCRHVYMNVSLERIITRLIAILATWEMVYKTKEPAHTLKKNCHDILT